MLLNETFPKKIFLEPLGVIYSNGKTVNFMYSVIDENGCGFYFTVSKKNFKQDVIKIKTSVAPEYITVKRDTMIVFDTYYAIKSNEIFDSIDEYLANNLL